MDLHFIIAFFIASFFSVHGNPLDKSVYETIKNSAHFKCPYLRSTKLLEPEPKVLSKCVSFKAAQTLTALSPTTVQDGLCLLYYDNFQHLCYVSNNYSAISKELLSNDQIDQVLTTYQNNVSQVCAVLKETQNFDEDTKSVIEVVREHLQTSRKCELLCLDLDANVKPICSLTAFMVNSTTQFYKESQNRVSVDTKTGKTVNKPAVIDHNADTSQDGFTNKQSNIANKKPSEAGVDITNSVLEGSSFATQKNSSIQNVPQNSSKLNGGTQDESNNEQRWKLFMPPQISGSEQSEQSAALKSLTTSSDASIKNIQGKKPEENSGVEKETLDASPTTVAIRQNKVEPTKDEAHVIPPINTEQKSEAPQLSSNLGENNEHESVVKLPPLEEKSDNKVEIEMKEKTNANKDQNAGEKIPEVDGNSEILSSLNKIPPKGDDTKNDPHGVQVQDNKLSTKAGEDVEAAGAPPQDLPPAESNVDSDIDPDVGNDEEYEGLNEGLPKSDDVKTDPGEKSKPLETDEDGPSFAANYQNQSIDDSDSYFFSYFMMVCIMFICGYVAYHNKQKILALVVEGRKGRRPSRTRRPNSANYRKLDSNLEEAVTSACNKNATQVIY